MVVFWASKFRITKKIMMKTRMTKKCMTKKRTYDLCVFGFMNFSYKFRVLDDGGER